MLGQYDRTDDRAGREDYQVIDLHCHQHLTRSQYPPPPPLQSLPQIDEVEPSQFRAELPKNSVKILKRNSITDKGPIKLTSERNFSGGLDGYFCCSREASELVKAIATGPHRALGIRVGQIPPQ